MERTDVDWMREIAAEKKAPRPEIKGRAEAFDQGAVRSKPVGGLPSTPAAKGGGAVPASTIMPTKTRRKFGFL